MVKEYRISTLTASAAMLAVGLLLLIKPKTSLIILCFTIAALLFFMALVRLFRFLKTKKENPTASKFNMFSAILLVIIAAYLLIRPDTIARIIPVVLGIIIIANGILMILAGLIYTSWLPNRGIATIILGLISFVLGFYAIRHSFGIQVALMQFIGVALTVTAAFNISNHIMLERAEAKKENATTVKFESVPNKKNDDEKQ